MIADGKGLVAGETRPLPSVIIWAFQEQKPFLLVDIGTNGEIALWNQGTLLCCATAAGPAFEGAGLSMGMQGEEGAVSHVEFVGAGEPLQIEVIGLILEPMEKQFKLSL